MIHAFNINEDFLEAEVEEVEQKVEATSWWCDNQKKGKTWSLIHHRLVYYS